MTVKEVLLHGGPCHGANVIWAGGDLRMVKCLQGYTPWPYDTASPLIDHELYRPSVDSPSIFVWVQLGKAEAPKTGPGMPFAAGHPYR